MPVEYNKDLKLYEIKCKGDHEYNHCSGMRHIQTMCKVMGY